MRDVVTKCFLEMCGVRVGAMRRMFFVKRTETKESNIKDLSGKTCDQSKCGGNGACVTGIHINNN